jgi:hypothetical protein
MMKMKMKLERMENRKLDNLKDLRGLRNLQQEVEYQKELEKQQNLMQNHEHLDRLRDLEFLE